MWTNILTLVLETVWQYVCIAFKILVIPFNSVHCNFRKLIIAISKQISSYILLGEIMTILFKSLLILMNTFWMNQINIVKPREFLKRGLNVIFSTKWNRRLLIFLYPSVKLQFILIWYLPNGNLIGLTLLSMLLKLITFLRFFDDYNMYCFFFIN